MEVRISFRVEVFIEGENLDEIKEKWGNLPVFSEEAKKYDADFVELVSVEDADTYEDLSNKW